MSQLILRPFVLTDERQALTAHDELAADSFGFLLSYEGQSWADYVQQLADMEAGLNLPDGFVPSALLAAVVDGQIVGRSSIRYELNDYLARSHGHIGYGVRPEFRRRGYATEILRQSLQILAERGVDSALVTCDHDNVGSAKTIERCGGVFESLVDAGHGVAAKRRYWVPTI